jgi:hypothetical protein
MGLVGPKGTLHSFVKWEACVVFEIAVCARCETGQVKLEMDGVRWSKRALRARYENDRVCVGFEMVVCAL